MLSSRQRDYISDVISALARVASATPMDWRRHDLNSSIRVLAQIAQVVTETPPGSLRRSLRDAKGGLWVECRGCAQLLPESAFPEQKRGASSGGPAYFCRRCRSWSSHKWKIFEAHPLLRAVTAPQLMQGEQILPLRLALERHVLEAVKACGGNKAQAARALGISNKTIFQYLRRIRAKNAADRGPGGPRGRVRPPQHPNREGGRGRS